MTREPAPVDLTAGKLTPYRALDQTLRACAAAMRDALEDNFVGLYLLGSLAIGDFDLTSDVDFTVVTNYDLSTDEVERVQSAHADVLAQDDRWVRHLEYSLFPVPQLLHLSSPYRVDGARNSAARRRLWYFANGSATLEPSDHDNTLVTRWTLRHKGAAVVGPDPSTFAPEVTADLLRREIKSSMLGWERLMLTDPSSFDNRFHQVFFVLNNCRALQDLHEGRITSKLEGARWARQHLDGAWHPLIDYCWQERQDTGIHVSQPAEPEAFRRTIEFVRYTARLAEAYRLPS